MTEDEPAQREAAALKAWSSEPTEGEKWAKFPSSPIEAHWIEELNEKYAPHSPTAKMLIHLLEETIKQRAEISTLKTALNIEETS